jgi:hypothetical protein
MPRAPSLSFAAQSSLDLGRESVARSSDLIFSESPPAATPPTPPSPAATATADPRMLGLAAVLGLDSAGDAVREARQLIFESGALQALQRADLGEQHYGIRGSASPESVGEPLAAAEIAVQVPWNAAFRARTVDIDGRTYGHIHVRTFYVEDADGFVREFIRLLKQIPENGLILDVRGNSGGNIWAAERLLQTLAAAEIEPERMQFIVTPGTLDLCRNNPENSPIDLHWWQPSLEEAVETGSIYSHAFPLTTKESCNAIGQQYYGPVVLLVDGNCYSATDIFAAGFQDHRIGKILGVSSNTGAGGANVWEHWLLHKALPQGWGLKPLPNQASLRVAIRQCLRVGTRAGALLEDFGVVPDAVHRPERADVMEGDRVLLAHAAEFLSAQSRRSIEVTTEGPDPDRPGMLRIVITTQGLKRLDFFVDGRPKDSRDLVLDKTGQATLRLSIWSGADLKLTGYAELDDAFAVALYRGRIA